MRIIEKPLVSIALCTYNGERFLRKQLDSLLLQDYENIEIIAVDDCSTDRTWNILGYYARRDRRLHIHQNEENLGYARNFEKAIKLCSADFIALADQDDIWIKSKIKALVRAIKENVMVYHDSDFIDEHSKRIGRLKMSSKFRMYQGESSLPFVLANCISGHAIMFRRELVKYIFPFEPGYYHDWWISYVAFNVGRVKYINKVLVHYRQHDNSITDLLDLRKRFGRQKKVESRDRLPVSVSWLEYCSRFKYNKESGLVRKTFNLLLDLKKGKGRLKTLVFLVKYYDQLFYIAGKQRSLLSKINFARKICFY